MLRRRPASRARHLGGSPFGAAGAPAHLGGLRIGWCLLRHAPVPGCPGWPRPHPRGLIGMGVESRTRRHDRLVGPPGWAVWAGLPQRRVSPATMNGMHASADSARHARPVPRNGTVPRGGARLLRRVEPGRGHLSRAVCPRGTMGSLRALKTSNLNWSRRGLLLFPLASSRAAQFKR